GAVRELPVDQRRDGVEVEPAVVVERRDQRRDGATNGARIGGEGVAHQDSWLRLRRHCSNSSRRSSESGYMPRMLSPSVTLSSANASRSSTSSASRATSSAIA